MIFYSLSINPLLMYIILHNLYNSILFDRNFITSYCDTYLTKDDK